MQRFHIPKDIVFGAGSVECLAELQGARAIVVTGGSSMKKFGFLQKAVDLLTKAGMTVQVIDGVEPDPSVKTVYSGAEAMQEFKPDWIVALGGGSTIDAAKAMWVFYEHPNLTFPDILKPFSIPKLRGKARFAAISSTSGTASEVTCASVIADYDTPNKIKYPLVSYEITPDIAIVDPNLTVTMPPHVTAHTGLDALSHAIEAYVSTYSSHFTDPLALEAAKLAFAYLPKAYRNGQDMEARGKMHYAQCLAGIACANALLGIAHSMSAKIGAQFAIPHGEATTILLPHVIAYNAVAAGEAYGEIARHIGIHEADNAKATEKLIAAIRELNSQVGVPASLQSAGVDEKEFFAKLTENAENALQDPCTGTNPRIPSVEDIEIIYKTAFKS